MKRWNITLTFVVLLILTPMFAARAAERLGAGAGTCWTPWQTVSNINYRISFTITGLPSLFWEGGSMNLPIVSGVFHYLPNGHFPYYMVKRQSETHDGWEEVYGRYFHTNDVERMDLIGLWEGLLIEQSAWTATNSATYLMRMKAIYPRHFYSMIPGAKFHARRDKSLPFKALLDDGSVAEGQLNRGFAPLTNVRRLEIRDGAHLIVMDLTVTGPPPRNIWMKSAGNPESVSTNAVEVAQFAIRPLRGAVLAGDWFELTVQIQTASGR